MASRCVLAILLVAGLAIGVYSNIGSCLKVARGKHSLPCLPNRDAWVRRSCGSRHFGVLLCRGLFPLGVVGIDGGDAQILIRGVRRWGARKSWRSTAKLLTQARGKSVMLQVLHHLAGSRGRCGREDMETGEGREVLRLEGWSPVGTSLEGEKRRQKILRAKRRSSK